MSRIDEVFSERFHLFEGHKETLSSRDIIRAVSKDFDAPLVEYSSPDVEIESTKIPGPQGEIPIRLYRPRHAGRSSEKLPGLIWFHGGAFLFGSLDMNEADVVSREIAARAQTIVMSVDYRLVTSESKFPTCQIDSLAASQWFLENLEKLSVDVSNVVIGGGSAGAALAASTALRLRDMELLAGIRTMLIYPTLHSSLPEPSQELASKLGELPKPLVFDPEWTNWISQQLGAEFVDKSFHINPGDHSNLEGLTQTLIINSEYDSLRSSGEKYAQQLAAAGNDVKLFTQNGAIHGHLNRHPGESWSMDQSLQIMSDFITNV